MGLILLVSCLVGLVVLYLYHVNRGMSEVPEEARLLSPHRWTVDQVKAAYKKSTEAPVDVTRHLPPKQQRRYIVVGGSGLVGNWIVSHLLSRGETPAAVRVLDIESPRPGVQEQGVTYMKTDVADEAAVSNAFSQKWPQAVADLPLTVFHLAAVIRPAERLKEFRHLSSNVNVDGTKNVLNAAKKTGASCLITTSSGSVGIHRPTFWIFPWTRRPTRLLQVLDDMAKTPKEHNEFFGNYAASKMEAEIIVRNADDPQSNFRTGCIRPTNGIYGIGRDTSPTVIALYLSKGGSVSWTYPVIHSFVNVENVSIAHLLYEQRLIELRTSSNLPDIGGQSFIVTDPNPAISFSDIYLLLSTLSKTPVKFPKVPPVLFLILSHLVEWYIILQHRYFAWLLPKVTGDLAQLQPGLFDITNVHSIADDRRAQKSPEQGGLGYHAPISTLDGMCIQLKEWNHRVGKEVPAAMMKEDAATVFAEEIEASTVVPPMNL